MRAPIQALPGHVATLQCIAAFREQADDLTARGVELRPIATVLGHMAAALLVPSMPALALVAGTGIEQAAHDEGQPMRFAVPALCSDRNG